MGEEGHPTAGGEYPTNKQAKAARVEIDQAKADEIGLAPFTVYVPKALSDDQVRSAASGAERKAKSRKSKASSGFRQINVDAPDDEPIRNLIRMIAKKPVAPGETNVFQALASEPSLVEMVEHIRGAPALASIFQRCVDKPDFMALMTMVAAQSQAGSETDIATTGMSPAKTEEFQAMASAFRKMLMTPGFRRVVIALEGASAEALEATDHVLQDESMRRAVLNTASHFESERTHPLSQDQQMVASLLPIMLERMDITRFLANVMATIPQSETIFLQRSERALALLKLEFQASGLDV